MNDELQTCIYDYMPHRCEHWIDDADYHELRDEAPCIHPVERQGVEG